MRKKIYVASSWRNQRQQSVVAALRAAGHEVYDFKNPGPGESGFGWSQIDPDWQQWTPEQYRKALEHPIATHGFARDMDALSGCDACVLVMPCGRSAHLELGWAAGARRETYVLLDGPSEPELMYLMNNAVVTDMDDLLRRLSGPVVLAKPTLADLTLLVDDLMARSKSFGIVDSDRCASPESAEDAEREATDAKVALLAALAMLTERES